MQLFSHLSRILHVKPSPHLFKKENVVAWDFCARVGPWFDLTFGLRALNNGAKQQVSTRKWCIHHCVMCSINRGLSSGGPRAQKPRILMMHYGSADNRKNGEQKAFHHERRSVIELKRTPEHCSAIISLLRAIIYPFEFSEYHPSGANAEVLTSWNMLWCFTSTAGSVLVDH